MCLKVSVSPCLSIYASMSVCLCRFVSVSVFLLVHLYLCVPVSAYLCLCLSCVCLFVCLSFMSVCISVYLCVCVYISLCLFVLCLCISVSVCVSLCPVVTSHLQTSALPLSHTQTLRPGAAPPASEPEPWGTHLSPPSCGHCKCQGYLLLLLPCPSRGSSWDINSLPMCSLCSHLREEQSSQQPEKLRQPLMGTLGGAGMVYPLHPLSPPVSEKLSTHPGRALMEPPVAQGLVEHSRCFLRAKLCVGTPRGVA